MTSVNQVHSNIEAGVASCDEADDGTSRSETNISAGEKDEEMHQVSSQRMPDHTVFSVNEKYLLVFLSSSTAIWSSFGSPIYYPALQILEGYFHIDQELVNVSVVVYMVFQGLSPTFFAAFADKYGRRPVLLVCLVIFIGASIGLAVSNSYALILVLRCIQSAGISPAISISCGVIGDYTLRHERGWYVGLTTGFTLMGQAFGSLIGAGLIAGFDWRAIFWFLAIGGGVVLILDSLLLPETKRSIVGNGSIKPKSIINKSPILLLPNIQRKWRLNEPDLSTKAEQGKIDLLSSIRILGVPEVSLCLLTGAIHFALWTVQLTELSDQLSKGYGYSVMKIGLCYLPGGIGGLFGSFMSGRLLDWYYRRSLKKFEDRQKAGLTGEKEVFNHFKTRIKIAVPYALMTDLFTIMFGWCLDQRVHVASVLVSAFFISYGCMGVNGINTTLLIDLYPSKSSAATSAVNLTRCITGAVFIAALASMNKSMTVGGTFTLLAALGAVAALLLLIPLKYAPGWQLKRKEREEARKLKAVNATTN